MKKSYHTTKGPKQDIRDSICQAAIEFDINPKRIFTLPDTPMLCVKTFHKNFPNANITGIECDTEKFHKIAAEAPLGLTIENVTIEEYSKKSTLQQHFDIVFLDYYSALTRKTMQEVFDFINNDNLVHKNKQSIVAMTFQKVDRQGGTEDLVKSAKEYLWDMDYENSAENMKTILIHNLMEFSPYFYESSEYKNAGGSPMYYFILKVMKL